MEDAEYSTVFLSGFHFEINNNNCLSSTSSHSVQSRDEPVLLTFAEVFRRKKL